MKGAELAPALALLAGVVVLIVHNLRVERLPRWLYVPACLASATALVGFARWAGLDAGELGLSAAGVGAGLVIGGAAALLVGIAGLLPSIRPVFADRRMSRVRPLGMAYRVLVRIPLGTVVVEEIAFRGVLPALLDRLVPLGWAVAASCVLFGLWHVVPTRATLRTNHLPARPVLLGGVVVATAAVGAGLSWLRVWSGGLAAPAIADAAASGAATVVSFLVLEGRWRRIPTEHPGWPH